MGAGKGVGPWLGCGWPRHRLEHQGVARDEGMKAVTPILAVLRMPQWMGRELVIEEPPAT